MTRNYFVDFVTTWEELLELCSDEDCDVCEDVISDDALDEWVDSDIRDTEYGWRDIRDFLAGIPSGYDYYLFEGSFEYSGLDGGDFADFKNRVLEWMDDNNQWEDEDDEDEGEYIDEDLYDWDSVDDEDGPDMEPADSDEPRAEEEDISINDLMTACGAKLVSIRHIAEQRGETENASLLAV